MSFWYFVRSAPGELAPVALRRMERFFRGREKLSATEPSALTYVRVRVQMLQRTAMSVEEIACERAPLLEDGRLDEARWALAAGRERIAAGKRPKKLGERVVDASHRFEERRQRALASWEPTRADADALRALVNRKAGWAML